MQKPTKERFLEDIKKHKLKIIKDEDTYRHLIMTSGSSIFKYEIITWPNYLCICGDMGCFVFSRIEDMFQFFRSPKDELYINPSYWHEKLQGKDKTDSFKEFDPKIFEKIIKEIFEETTENKSKEEKEKIWEIIQDEILVCGDSFFEESYEEIIERAEESAERYGIEGFTDMHDYDFNSFTYSYIWCLYAIVYAIQKYDEEKKE
jgi:hypothetical protein